MPERDPPRRHASPRRARRARWGRGRRCGARAGSGRWSRPSRSPPAPPRPRGRAGAAGGTARRRPCSRVAGRAWDPRRWESRLASSVPSCERRAPAGQRPTPATTAPTSTSAEPAIRSAPSRPSAASPQPHHAPRGDQHDRRLPQRRDDRERRPGQRREHERVGAERREPADDRRAACRRRSAGTGDCGRARRGAATRTVSMTTSVDRADRPQERGVQPRRRLLDGRPVEGGVAGDHDARSGARTRPPRGRRRPARGGATAAGPRGAPTTSSATPSERHGRELLAEDHDADDDREHAARSRGRAGTRPTGRPAGRRRSA